jgi:transcriptional repressor NrdR
MQCPYCGFEESKVIDSRDVSDGVRRRRQCESCEQRFTTYERIETAPVYIIKKDGRREEFRREKLLAGVRKACEKRPLPTGALEGLVDDVQSALQQRGQAEVPSRVLGELVMERLRELDHIAYIRFASVYRDFRDVADLEEALEALREGRRVPANQLTLLPEESDERILRRTAPNGDTSKPRPIERHAVSGGRRRQPQ